MDPGSAKKTEDCGILNMPQPKKFSEQDFEIRTSTIQDAGLGLFAKETIHSDDTIGYYTGEVIEVTQLHDSKRASSAYLLWICRNHIIVGHGPKANYTRYINHSNQPNAFLVVSTRWKTARIEAIQTIQPGEEIFFNYGEDYWDR
jgi:SET domain-containing protein